MKGIIFLVCLLSIALTVVSGCSNQVSIRELHKNSESYMGKEIVTQGIVNSTTKILSLIGFKLQDEAGENSIFVQLPGGSALPEEGAHVTVKGTLQEGLLGYHIYASEVY